MLQELLSKIDKSPAEIDKEVVIRAYNLASLAHKGQTRLSGEPYVVHPIEVAGILVEIGVDTNTIAAALLHDVVEDSDYTYEDIEKGFGHEVAELVEGVTKLGKIEYRSREEEQADNVRKMVLAMSKDIRVVLIKLADRLHNMRTLRFKSPDKQKEKAKEVFDIYAPLAHRLGMFKIKWELEDLAFRYLNPTEYYDLVDQIAEKRKEREEYIQRIIAQIKGDLERAGIPCDIDGRPKHFYSIYKKMNNKSKTLDQIFDLTAIRVLVGTIKECYGALGQVHTIFKPIPGRFKDYIAMPKPNMYQSLHTTVIGPQGKPFEVQIRTYEMHRTAEYGIAAHWNYKEGNDKKTVDQRYVWLREMLEWGNMTQDAGEFMDGFKVDLLEGEVLVFTPKGDVISLPPESTPLDFAYRIHTDIGHRTVGAKVNGNMVSLDYRLKTGEIVEILTAKGPKEPSIHWLSMVKSNHAKSKIRSWFKKEKREENILKGRELLEKEAKKRGHNFSEIARGVPLHQIITRYNGTSIEDLYVEVGSGQTPAAFVVTFLTQGEEKALALPTLEEELVTAKDLVEDAKKKAEARKKRKKLKSENFFGVTVTGMDNVEVRFAKCCTPLPGEDIEGFITNVRGISVHRSDCPNFLRLKQVEDPDRFVEVAWQNQKDSFYAARLRIDAENRQNLLTDVMMVLQEMHVGTNAVNAEEQGNGKSVIELSLLISSSNLLTELIKRLKKLPAILDVHRVGGA
ncbi:GTP pyrophosphokinaseppGpp synthetase I [Clostridiaceae bacterium JG1575]|nr:GTP pyrophosphokinaseppGpp synthetase I [Clostridiaceae bacterium JG1575]